jgi:hypothetical protein
MRLTEPRVDDGDLLADVVAGGFSGDALSLLRRLKGYRFWSGRSTMDSVNQGVRSNDRTTIILSGALTHNFRYSSRAVASHIWLSVETGGGDNIWEETPSQYQSRRSGLEKIE